MSDLAVKNALKCYIITENGKTSIDKETFLPSAAYISDGKITDFMFDSFIFLPSPNYVYDYHTPIEQLGGDRKKAFTKEQLKKYIDEQLLDNFNCSALEEALSQAKETLKNTDYKANVFPSLFLPPRRLKDFGEVDGKMLDGSSDDNRIEILKWMMDETVRSFNSKGYKNVCLKGFYLFHEAINVENDGKVLRAMSDYAHSLGYEIIWGPYFGAKGYNCWEECGFDYVAMQANYFPARPDWPNAGSIERLKKAADIIKDRNMGVELELSGTSRVGITGLKEYLKAGVQFGYMNRYSSYYICQGPKSINEILKSEDKYVCSVYTDLYKYLKEKLSISEIEYENC